MLTLFIFLNINSSILDTRINNLKLKSSHENSIILLGTGQEWYRDEDDNITMTFFNSDKSQVLKLYKFPGGSKYDIDKFEVYYTNDTAISNQSLEDISYITNNNISLGINECDFIKYIGMNEYKVERFEDKVIYSSVILIKNNEELKDYNMPIYIAKYEFVDSKLNYFRFGFEYP